MLEKTPDFIGRALAGLRAGSNHLMWAEAPVGDAQKMDVSSTSFGDGGLLPAVHTADGSGVSPQISWRGTPQSAAGVLIVVEDADSPTPRPIVHLLALAPADALGVAEEGDLNSGGGAFTLGHNSFGGAGWLPPDPPPGHGPHSYVTQVFALAAPALLTAGFSKHDAVKALEAGVLAFGVTHAVYGRGAASAGAGALQPALVRTDGGELA